MWIFLLLVMTAAPVALFYLRRRAAARRWEAALAESNHDVIPRAEPASFSRAKHTRESRRSAPVDEGLFAFGDASLFPPFPTPDEEPFRGGGGLSGGGGASGGWSAAPDPASAAEPTSDPSTFDVSSPDVGASVDSSD